MNDWQCLLCGATFDGHLHTRPERCPLCQAPERYIVCTEERAKIEHENRAINKNDEFLEDMKDE